MTRRRSFLRLFVCLVGMAMVAGLVPGQQRSRPDRAPRNPHELDPSAPPNLWQLREPLDPPRVEPRADDPVIDVAGEADGIPLTGGDLDPTIDVQITQEIIDKAAELGTPERMYEFVRNECEFQSYYGSQKGSVETLRQRSGNDWDLASLLIALLRASGIPSRYAVGFVEMPADRAMSWLAVEDGIVAASILFTYGMEGTAVVSGPNVVAVRARRVWVEAYVSRGRGSASWVPLDPAFKQSSVHAGIDIPEEMGLDAQALVEEYWDPLDSGVTLPREETIVDLMRAKITEYLDASRPGTTIEDVRRTHEISTEVLGALPASLPYIVRSRDTQFSEIPAVRRYQIRFDLHNGGTPLIDTTLDLPTIAGKRITIDYVGASPADQATLDANGGIYFTAPSTVSLKPVLRVDGTDVAVGANGVGMGRVHQSDIHFLEPANDFGLPQNVVPVIFNSIVCGASQAIGLGIEGNADNLLVPPPADDLEGMAPLVWNTALDYLSGVRNEDLEVARLMHAYVATGVTDAIVQNVVNVTYSGGGVPLTFEWVGLLVDADRSVLGVWPVDRLDPSSGEPKDFLVISGAEGSLFENRVYESSFGQDSVSTIKILELAIDAGVTVYKRWDTLPLPPNSLPASVRSAIENAILNGHEETFPASQITAGTPATGQWTGVGWIDMDPSNGAAGYLISGAHNGGATVETWPPEFIDLSKDDRTVVKVEIHIKGGDSPAGDSPDPNSVFTRDNEEKLVFEYKVHVTYDDGSTRIMPDGGGYYRRETRNTTKTFVPGNYKFTVWISRRIWWIFSSTIAEAERNVSIVGVLIREDDGSTAGKTPPKLIRVKPMMGATPMKKLKALVIPTNAPDGSMLASAYAWTGGSKLTFKTPATQATDIEPAGTMPSAMLDDEAVDVVVTLPGGKTQNGYAKFVFAAGGMDEKHKMTVFSVEVDKAPMAFLPQGGTADNEVMMTARALPSGLKGEFTFKLEDVSEENGFCSNAPESLPFLPWSEDGRTFDDFQFTDPQADFDVEGFFDKSTAKAKNKMLDTVTARVKSYDYGAFGKLKVEFKFMDETIVAVEKGGTKEFTNLPLDDDDNHIADGWMFNAGGNTDDTDNNPALGMTMGDGLSRYEEYRGFLINGTHTRTSPNDKDLFIWDQNGIGLGHLATLGLALHTIREAEFNGRNNREVNFRHESHHVVLQHGLWLRDFDLGGMGSWGSAEAVGSPGTGRTHVNVDLAQVRVDMRNPPPMGFQPVGAMDRTGPAIAQLIAHELGHAVAIFHHGPGTYVGNHGGDTTCVMRYYFIDMNNANALAPPADVAAFNTFPIGTTFCNAAPDVCRSDVDVSDQ